MRAYHHTYGLPVLTTNCSNNYGPYQFPEKLIPLMIANALEGKPLPVYGDGRQVRDWLYVGDHCEAIRRVLAKGRPGEVYNIGGNAEKRNLEVVHAICDVLAGPAPARGRLPRPHHLRGRPPRPRPPLRHRRAQDPAGARLAPRESFETGLARTVRWYLDNAAWVAQVRSGEYRRWIEKNYEKRA